MDRLSHGAQRTEVRLTSAEAHSDAPTDTLSRIEVPRTLYTRFGKRAFDLTIATMLFFIVTPLLLLGALVVRLSIGRPVFIKQFRVGRGSRPFEMRRLRTKRASRELDLRDPPASDNEGMRQSDDPSSNPATGVRVSFNRTTATRRVHRWRFDALPQLINVLRGEMSLVGPRPMTWQSAVSERLLDHPRHDIRPGLTGPAQLAGRGDESLAEQLELDCTYIENIGLRRDISLLIATVVAVLRR